MDTTSENQGIGMGRVRVGRATIVAVLLAFIIFLCAQYYLQVQELQLLKKELQYEQVNQKITGFLNLFIAKVLKAEGEVSFEDRLKLENTIRDLNDRELLRLWEKFTQAQTVYEIQQSVKDLLQALVQKIYINK